MTTIIHRCHWCGTDPDYVRYHDQVWGRPVRDSQELFAKLCLEGQQAGLSWITILRKQRHYENAFCQFNPYQLVTMPQAQRDALIHNAGIVRNRLKIAAIFKNAGAYLALAEQGIAFNEFLWEFSQGKPRIFARQGGDIPATDEVSDAMAKALKKLGFSFVGSTICYALMQAVGMVNDHVVDCHCYASICEQMETFSL